MDSLIIIIWLIIKLTPYLLVIYVIFFIISFGPFQLTKGRKKIGVIAILSATIPLGTLLVNEMFVVPYKFKKACSSEIGQITLNPVETNQIALDIKHYAYHSGITIDDAVKKVISGDFKEVEVINNQGDRFQKMVEKYGLNQKLKNNEPPKVFVFSIANKNSGDCWWHDFVATSTQSWKNPARATRHFKSSWDKANNQGNECISLQYRDKIQSRYIVEIKEDQINYSFNRYSILVRDTFLDNSVISENIAYGVDPTNDETNNYNSNAMMFVGKDKLCPRNALWGNTLNLLFN